MNFTATPLHGAWIIDAVPHEDERGLFARTFCSEEFQEHGLESHFPQCNTSFNLRRATLRGMHFQVAPFEEVKLVRCTRGSALDVIIDLRLGSPTRLQHFALELTADNRRALYVPAGFAHGFQTLEDGTELFYQMSQVYSAPHGRGVRWNDPVFGIDWPLRDPILNERDGSYPDSSPAVTPDD